MHLYAHINMHTCSHTTAGNQSIVTVVDREKADSEWWMVGDEVEERASVSVCVLFISPYSIHRVK